MRDTNKKDFIAKLLINLGRSSVNRVNRHLFLNITIRQLYRSIDINSKVCRIINFSNSQQKLKDSQPESNWHWLPKVIFKRKK